MIDHLREAIEALQIEDVYLARASSYLGEGFDPKYSFEEKKLTVQFKHLVEKSEVLQLTEEKKAKKQKHITIFRVFVTLGARWIPEDSGTEDDVKVEAQIEATYVAEYLMKHEVKQEALDAFALNNASYHIWPYWREYVMNQGMRMNLPKVALPTLQLAKNR